MILDVWLLVRVCLLARLHVEMYPSRIFPFVVEEGCNDISGGMCVYVRMNVCMYVHMYACMFVCMYVCIYVHMYVCEYVCVSTLCVFTQKTVLSVPL
jgi:hypothetical protein